MVYDSMDRESVDSEFSISQFVVNFCYKRTERQACVVSTNVTSEFIPSLIRRGEQVNEKFRRILYRGTTNFPSPQQKEK